MPPVGGKNRGKPRGDARSRNTTPISTGSTEQVSSISGGPTTMSYDELLDKYGGVNSPPASNTLKSCLESLKAFSEVAKIRSNHCHDSMLELSRRINDLRQRLREREIATEREEEERKDKDRAKKAKLKKEREEERPMAVGAHALARQDGMESTGEPGELDRENASLELVRQQARSRSQARVYPHRTRPSQAPNYDENTLESEVDGTNSEPNTGGEEGTPTMSEPSSGTDTQIGSVRTEIPSQEQPLHSEDVTLGDRLPTTELASAALPLQPERDDPARSPHSRTSSVSSHQPRPEPAVPQYQTFGPDPSTFDDPTIYHIRDIDPNMTEEEKKEILGVSVYPHDDLKHLTVGPLPDQNLENAKPSSQVTAHQFQTYLEPYIRPYTEEDISFLKERSDQVGPFVIPRRGPRHYKEIWAEEDQSSIGDSIQHTTEEPSTNEASGSIEQMTDEMAETSEISLGPTTSRFLALLRPERRALTGEASTNGESTLDGDSRLDIKNEEQQNQTLPPATCLPESFRFPTNASLPRLEARELDERLRIELRHCGLLDEDAEPDYEGHYDDEVAARLRYLQDELKRVSQLNGARKSRVLEIMEEAAAKQEWSTIADDLDSQLNQAYLKRHRNIGKGKNKLKRPGGPGGGSHSVGGGVSKPGLGESIRALMQRREDWSEIVGPVVDYGKSTIPHTTIFDDENMKRLLALETEGWNEAQGSQ